MCLPPWCSRRVAEVQTPLCRKRAGHTVRYVRSAAIPEITHHHAHQESGGGVDVGERLLSKPPGSSLVAGEVSGDIIALALGGVGGAGTAVGATADSAEDTASAAANAADAALQAGKTRGAASALRLPGGGPLYVDISGSPRVFTPEMQSALDSVPPDIRPGWHGWCSEIGCMNQALGEKASLNDGMMDTVAIGLGAWAYDVEASMSNL
jgi:hypothetical protein